MATIYKDGKNAHWDKNPKSYLIEKFIVDHTTVMKFTLASGGGTAISIRPANATDMKIYKKFK